jgi:sulfatase maturation enzyme AslB (radical SAM superfamily)
MSSVDSALSHLYISPLERCNLNCKICYTRKTQDQLSQKQVLDFVQRYCQEQTLETITFCGGEVFLLDWFPHLVNQLTAQGLIVEIITNGTLDGLEQLNQPNQINLIVSLDGLPADHDANRGPGMFKKSLNFLKKAQELGFHTEVFTVVSQKNYSSLDQFENYLNQQLGSLPTITYHPRKPRSYLNQHPVSNRAGDVQEFGFLTTQQILHLAKTKKVFPPPELGCFQISLMSDGQVYACCEGIKPLGNISTPIHQLIKKFKNRIKIPPGFNPNFCQGCSEPDFVCGLAKVYNQLHSEK